MNILDQITKDLGQLVGLGIQIALVLTVMAFIGKT